MRNKRRLPLIALFLLLLAPLAARAAEPAPGDACSTAGSVMRTGGPETSGVGHTLICQGGTWKSALGFDASAQVTKIGNQTCSTNELLKFDGTKWVCGSPTIAADTILESMLKAVNAPTDEYCLTYESTTGDFEWQTCGSGGDNLGNHTATTNINLGANYISRAGTAAGISLDASNNMTISGDLTISGDDLFMATNTAGRVLIADGTNFNPTAVSGDITVTGAGVTAIGADKVTEAMLKAVNAATDEYCLTYETTTGDFEWQVCGGAETDPQVGTLTASKWCTSDGSAVNCTTNAPVTSETDPQVGTLTEGKWCLVSSGVIDCTSSSPGLPTCADGESVVASGGSWVCANNCNFPGTNWTAHESAREWWDIASSSDGTKLVAVGVNIQIYTSTDSGANWTARDSARNWKGVASSSDGTKLVAVNYEGQIYTSTNSGASWTARDSARQWTSVASSSDGTKLVATVAGGYIYTSTNSGASWTSRDSVRDWIDVASSSDGTKLVAVVMGGQIYTSTNSGVSWTARDSARDWYSVASSSDGTKLVATVPAGQIYTSTDSGVSWTPRDATRAWYGVASSSDGTQLLAAVASGQIYISTNSGVSWTPRGPSGNWVTAASSADGSKLAIAAYYDQIYTSSCP